MYEEYVNVKEFVTEEKVAEWADKKTLPPQRWMEMFSHFTNNQILALNVLKLAEFFFCLPGTNAATERVFSLMNSTWTSDKSQLGVNILKAILVTKVNYDETCVEFYKMLLSKKELLKEIHSSEKYSSCA